MNAHSNELAAQRKHASEKPDSMKAYVAPAAAPVANAAAEVKQKGKAATFPSHVLPEPTPHRAQATSPSLLEKCETAKRLRSKLLAQGYAPIAVRTGDKDSINTGWNTRVDGDANMPVTAGMLNTGIRSNGLRAVDVDVENPARADKIRELALRMLGRAPILWRENSSRVLLLYRAAEGEPKKLSITSKTFKSADGKFEKIEVLGSGQQFVAYGTHPTGAELRWKPEPPHRILRGELTSVTEAQIDAFLAEAAKIIDAPPPLPNCPPVAAGHKGNGQVSSPTPIPPCALSVEQRSHMENIATRSLKSIANAPRGTSNDTINKEAHTLGGLVAAGLPAEGLGEHALKLALERAAIGDNDPHETQATFESGWRSGLKSPWVPGAGMPAEAVEAARASAAPHLARLAAQRPANDFIKTGGGENACAESGRESTIDSLPTRRNRFVLESWKSITHDKNEEWLVKRILPRSGVAALYGKPGSFKNFVALYIAVSVASGQQCAGRRVTQAPVVYLAAEGAAGLRKRKAGFERAHPALSSSVPFYMIAAAPNLGAAPGDVGALGDAIEGAGVAPGLIVIDTLAQTLGSADENGSGMTTFVANAGEIASRFKCLVLIIHHVGLNDDKRLRGHSSLAGALDATLLCERRGNDLVASLTLQKLKDEASDVRLLALLSRVVMGQDEDGDEISTLIVGNLEDAEPAAPAPRTQSVPPAQRLLMAVAAEAIDEDGETMRPLADGPVVRAVEDSSVRDRYYARIAEQAEPDEDKDKIAGRRRRAFNRAIANAIKAQRIVAAEHKGRRVLWLP